LDEIAFLSRIFDLTSLPSHDSRFQNAEQDIWHVNRHAILTPYRRPKMTPLSLCKGSWPDAV
jgi:hypothetical protein